MYAALVIEEHENIITNCELAFNANSLAFYETKEEAQEALENELHAYDRCHIDEEFSGYILKLEERFFPIVIFDKQTYKN